VQLPNKVVSLGLASFRVLIVKVANMTGDTGSQSLFGNSPS